MYFKNFFFSLFIMTSTLFFISSMQPELTLNVCGSMCYNELSLSYIQLTSMFSSAIALILYLISNYYAEKKMREEIKRRENDRLNIEKIHAELEALKH